ncbi:MAG: T9SS type A sorting domain-containing protein [Bacteroidia bacterium]
MKKTTIALFSGLMLQAAFVSAQTYTKVYNIFQAHCTTCHDNTSPAGGMDLSAAPSTVYTTIMANPNNPAAVMHKDKRVKPGDPHHSFLLRKCQNGLDADNGLNTGEGNAMPGSPSLPLSNNDIELIRQWIYAGAPQTGNVVDTALINKYYSGLGIDGKPASHPLPTDPGSFQVHVGKVFLDTLSEVEYFLKYDLQLPDTLEVNRIELFLPTQSHHYIIYKFLPGAASGFADGIRIQNPSTGAGSSGGYNTLVSAFQSSRNDVLPTATAYQWETSTVLDLNHHFFNVDPDSVLGADVYFNVYTQPKGTAASIMYCNLVSNTSIYIPNDGANHTFTHADFNTTETRMWNIWLLSSHTHKYGIDFDIFLRNPGGTTGTQVFEGFYNNDYSFNQGYYDWEHPPVELFSPLLTMNPRDGLIQKATFNNNGPNSVFFGLTTHDEMMLYFIQYTLGAPIPAGIEEDPANAIRLNAFPNPFGSSTQISYELSGAANVSVAVFDVLGNKVATLLDSEMQSSGTHQVEFNAANNAKGIYLVTVTMNGQTFTKRIVLAE